MGATGPSRFPILRLYNPLQPFFDSVAAERDRAR